MNKPPRSNLPPDAEPWGRFITDGVQKNASTIEMLQNDSKNVARINSSTLDNLANQMEDIRNRQTGIVTYPTFSLPAFSTGTQATTISIQIPRPAVAKAGWCSVQFTAVNSNSLQTEVYASMFMDDVAFHRDSRSVPTSNFEPPSWGGDKSLIGYSGFFASPTSGGTVSLLLETEILFSSGSRFVTFKDIKVVYQYGQNV